MSGSSLPRRARTSYTMEFKLQLVEKSVQPGACVAQLAREHGINDNLLFTWRQRYRQNRQNVEDRHQHRHTRFKKLSPRWITTSPVAHADVSLICELDEQWAFVGSKVMQHWLWYAYNTKTGGELAYTFGPRNDETCRGRLALLTPFDIGMITCGGWGSYAR